MAEWDWTTWPPHVPTTRVIQQERAWGEKQEEEEDKLKRCEESSHRGLRLQPHDELVALWVDEFLPESQEGERSHRDHQGEVQASQ